MTVFRGEPSRKHQYRIGFLIHDVSRLRCTVIDKALRPFGVTRAQWWVLANLSQLNAGGIPQSDLAKIMQIGKVTLGGMLDRLEEKSFIERQPRPGDRRIHRILLTTGGRKLLAQIDKVGTSVSDEILARISKDEVIRAEAVLSKMKDRLIEMDALPVRSRTGNSKPTDKLGQPQPQGSAPYANRRRSSRETQSRHFLRLTRTFGKYVLPGCGEDPLGLKLTETSPRQRG